MNRFKEPTPTDAQVLIAHEDKTIRAFLKKATVAEECALFDTVYSGQPKVSIETAQNVFGELSTSRHKVGEVLTGWRPKSL